MPNNMNRNKRRNEVETPYFYKDNLYLSLVSAHESLINGINWLQGFTGLASVRILSTVICGIIYLILFGFGAYYWNNVDLEMIKMYKNEQALIFVKKYDLGKLFLSNERIFHDGNKQLITNYFDNIVILLNNFDHLDVTNTELQNLCIINSDLGILPYR
jgi:hypothetical protein